MGTREVFGDGRREDGKRDSLFDKIVGTETHGTAKKRDVPTNLKRATGHEHNKQDPDSQDDRNGKSWSFSLVSFDPWFTKEYLTAFSTVITAIFLRAPGSGKFSPPPPPPPTPPLLLQISVRRACKCSFRSVGHSMSFHVFSQYRFIGKCAQYPVKKPEESKRGWAGRKPGVQGTRSGKLSPPPTPRQMSVRNPIDCRSSDRCSLNVVPYVFSI